MKTNEKVAISKVELKIAGKTIDLTLEQAKELKEILNQTFPEPVSYPIMVDRPVYVDRYPCEPWPYERWLCGGAMYGSSSSGSGSSFLNGTLTNTSMESLSDGVLTLEAR